MHVRRSRTCIMKLFKPIGSADICAFVEDAGDDRLVGKGGHGADFGHQLQGLGAVKRAGGVPVLPRNWP